MSDVDDYLDRYFVVPCPSLQHFKLMSKFGAITFFILRTNVHFAIWWTVILSLAHIRKQDDVEKELTHLTNQRSILLGSDKPLYSKKITELKRWSAEYIDGSLFKKLILPTVNCFNFTKRIGSRF